MAFPRMASPPRNAGFEDFAQRGGNTLFHCLYDIGVTQLIFLLLLSSAGASAQWTNLFDGKSFAGWRDVSKLDIPGTGWSIDNGAIKANAKAQIHEDLLSVGEYTDFELEWEWKIAPGSNSGLKYRLQDAVFMNESLKRPNIRKFEDTLKDEYERRPSDRSKLKPEEHGQVYTVAFEFQLIDDLNYKGGLKENQKTGSLYSFFPPTKVAAKTPGEWNTARLIVKGDHVEHYVNGLKVLDASLKAPEIEAGAKSRWGLDNPVYKLLTDQPKKKSPILLTNHGDEAWFRKLRIRSL